MHRTEVIAIHGRSHRLTESVDEQAVGSAAACTGTGGTGTGTGKRRNPDDPLRMMIPPVRRAASGGTCTLK